MRPWRAARRPWRFFRSALRRQAARGLALAAQEVLALGDGTAGALTATIGRERHGEVCVEHWHRFFRSVPCLRGQGWYMPECDKG